MIRIPPLIVFQRRFCKLTHCQVYLFLRKQDRRAQDICISSIQFMCGWVNRTEARRGSTAGTICFGTNCPKVQTYKNARTAGRYAGARNITVIIVLIYFMFMSRILRCGAWAFFDRRVLGGLQKAKKDTAIPPRTPPYP